MDFNMKPEPTRRPKALFEIPTPSGYESPILGAINQMVNNIQEQRDNAIMVQIREQIGVDVDKNELIRALNYDRDQFNEGYRKGYRDATERRNDTAALERVIKIMQNERKCVLRQDTSECDRDCANSELVLPKEDVHAAYDYVLTILHAIKLGYEIGGQIKIGGKEE